MRSKNSFFVLFLIFTFLPSTGLITAEEVSPYISSKTDRARCWNPSKTIPLSGKSCSPLVSPQISCYMPSDVEGELRQPNLNSRQRASDLFSWQEFIALDWPALPGHRGVPDADKPITAKGPRVWETWKEAYEVYLAHGEAPSGWNKEQKLPPDCGRNPDVKLLIRTEKIEDAVDHHMQAASATADDPATLTDQNGNLARYEIRMNKILFDYIIENRLYDGVRQAAADEVNFPDGSILIKASWREIGDRDKGAYYENTACICNSHDKYGVPIDCSIKKVGLVGLHIMHKTPSAPEWIWSTFEQVCNVTGAGGARPSFNNPACGPDECPPNRQTQPHTPNQITRLVKIPDNDPDCSLSDAAIDNIVLLNAEVKKSLAGTGSPFQYYHLIGTQWPLLISDSAVHTAATVFDVKPAVLSNTTMESFIQKTSSCMGCHSMSRTLRPDKFVSADFSFTLNNAKPHPRGADCTEISASESCLTGITLPPVKPETEWEKSNWDKVLKGREITLNTYELLGPELVGAKLHCGSCHLNAGGNPDAAWFVNMEEKYKTRKKLQERINRCFDQSLNGIPICDSENGECDKNPVMESLITYMEWLTLEWRKDGLPPAAHAFPEIAAREGNPDQGRKIFMQKCSFCHNTDAEGRYEGGAYFRPALVGPDSFNACAGMAKPGTIAEFVKSNMPYGSGGLLTAQEAWDLAAFIDGECRPGKGKDRNGDICSESRACRDGKPVNE